MKRVPLILRLVLSGALVGWLASRLDWPDLGLTLAGAHRGLLGAALLGSPVLIFLLAWRLQLLLRMQAIHVPFVDLLRMTWAGQFFNSFLPGTTGGDLFKLVQIGRLAPTAHTEGAAAIVLDRALAVAALALLAAVAVVAEPAPLVSLLGQGLAFRGVILAVLLAGAVAVAAVVAFRQRLGPVARLIDRGLTFLGGVVRALTRSLHWGPLSAAAIVLSLLIHLGNFLAVYLLARALGIGISFSQVLLMMPVVLFVIMLPLTINGHGLREVTMIGYFQLLGLAVGSGFGSGSQMAVALSLAFVANDLFCALPGGLWYLLSADSRPRASAASALPTSP